MHLKERICAALTAGVERLTPLYGGDLSQVLRADLADGSCVVAKTGPRAGGEARMLAALGAAGAPVPAVRHAEAGLLLMEHLAETPPSAAGWRALGTALGALHARTGRRYGWPEDHAFGTVAVLNGESADWPRFWAENRLLATPGALPDDLRARLERLAARLPELLPAAPPPALLHGDLWAGNVLFSGARAYLIDPACYYGDGEVDLAMLTLFGDPPPEFRAGYGALRPGHEARRPLYQLWPALVHLRLFGGGYRGMVCRLLDRLGA